MKTRTVLRKRLRSVNPAAPVFLAQEKLTAAQAVDQRSVRPQKRKSKEVAHWIDAEAFQDTHHHHDRNRHDESIHAFCLTFDQPIDWTAFGIWLSMLLQAHERGCCCASKACSTCVEWPARLPCTASNTWCIRRFTSNDGPDDDRRSRIVFIVRDLEQRAIEDSLAAFNALAEGPLGCSMRFTCAALPML